MSPTAEKSYARHLFGRLRCIDCLAGGADADAGAPRPIPRPEGIQTDVNFWIRVYTEVNDQRRVPARRAQSSGGLRHAEVRRRQFIARAAAPGRRPSRPAQSPRCAASSRRCRPKPDAKHFRRRTSSCSRCGVRIPAPSCSRDATQRIRFQLGQSDRFKEGLIRSSSWETHIAETFANQGCRPSSAVLPHVESSFNAGRLFEGGRRGSVAVHAFHRPALHARRRRASTSGSIRTAPPKPRRNCWPITTACSAAGRWRSPRTTTAPPACAAPRIPSARDDFVKINRTYNSRTFGFASRNFFPSFLAALTIDENPEKYFGTLERRPEAEIPRGHDAGLRAPGDAGAHARRRSRTAARAESRLAPDDLQRHAPGAARLPPAAAGRHGGEMDRGHCWRRGCRRTSCTPGQITPRTHRVPQGETLAAIAPRYGMTAARLARDERHLRQRAAARRTPPAAARGSCRA